MSTSADATDAAVLRIPLFGGAMSAAIPARFVDASRFREVPDNQEVLVDPDTDQSIIVEILEMEAEVPMERSARFFFQDLAEANDAKDNSVIESEGVLDASACPALAAIAQLAVAAGQQCVAKFREGDAARNVVQVHLVHVRLPHVASDVLITLNAPASISSASSSHGARATELASPEQEACRQLMVSLLASLTVHDWALFGNAGG